jgi:hypothetical protein
MAAPYKLPIRGVLHTKHLLPFFLTEDTAARRKRGKTVKFAGVYDNLILPSVSSVNPVPPCEVFKKTLFLPQTPGA